MVFQSVADYPIKIDKPWLLLGKGPSFSRVWDLDLSQYYTLGLNHVSLILSCDICSLVDIDVLSLSIQTQALFVPVHPHYQFRARAKILAYEDIFPHCDPKKVFVYNLSTWKQNHEEHYPIINARYFSSEAAISILRLLGVKLQNIYALGIDGGQQYAQEFLDLGLQPLTNGRKTFSDQFYHADLKWLQQPPTP